MNPNSALAQAESLLLMPFSLTEGDLARTFGQILTHQVDYADLYFQYSRSEAWSLDEGIVKSGSFNIDQGVGVRAVSGEKTAFAYSDSLSEAALADCALTVRTIASAACLDRVMSSEKMTTPPRPPSLRCQGSTSQRSQCTDPSARTCRSSAGPTMVIAVAFRSSIARRRAAKTSSTSASPPTFATSPCWHRHAFAQRWPRPARMY